MPLLFRTRSFFRSKPSTLANFQTAAQPAEHVGQCLELGSAAKPELLNPVEILLQERDRIVEAQRSERRIPDQADADGRPWRSGIGGRKRFSRDVPRRRALVVPERSDVGTPRP